MLPDTTVLKVPEVAAELRTSEWTVRELIRRGELRHVRLGRLIRVTRGQLDAFLAGELDPDAQALTDEMRRGVVP